MSKNYNEGINKILSLLSFSLLSAADLTGPCQIEGLSKKIYQHLDVRSLLSVSACSNIFNNKAKDDYINRIVSELEHRLSHRYELKFPTNPIQPWESTPESCKNVIAIAENIKKILSFIKYHGIYKIELKDLPEKILSYLLKVVGPNDGKSALACSLYLDGDMKFNDHHSGAYLFEFVANLIKINSINTKDENYHLYLFKILEDLSWVIQLAKGSKDKELQRKIRFAYQLSNKTSKLFAIDLLSLAFDVLPKIYSSKKEELTFDEIESHTIKMFIDIFYFYEHTNFHEHTIKIDGPCDLDLKDYVKSTNNTLSDFPNTIRPIINDPKTWKYAIKENKLVLLFLMTPPDSLCTILKNHADIRHYLLTQYPVRISKKLDFGVMLYPELKDQFCRIIDKIILDICDGKEYPKI